MKDRPTSLMLGAALMVGSIAGLASLHPQAVVPADADPGLFSAERAAAHVRQLAREPRPAGSEADQRARSYILEQLAELPVRVDTRTTMVLHDRSAQRPGLVIGAEVVNIAARLEGTGAGRAVLLMCHHDSAPGSPGAADDGAGVAALLETLRALSQGPKLPGDVIALFTDAEEVDLLGARAFVAGHPWLDDVVMAVNLEARGSRGAVLMFQTNPHNLRLIQLLDRSVRRPVAVSFSNEIYRRMPNDTDLSILLNAGVPGLNLAFIHDAAAYHRRLDTAERLNLGSLQHLGEYALGLARGVSAGLSPTNPRLPGALDAPVDAVYFNLGPGGFLVYSERLALPLAIVLALAWLGVSALGLSRRRLSILGALAGIACVLVATVTASLVTNLSLDLLVPDGPGVLLPWGVDSLSMLALAWALLAAAIGIIIIRLTATLTTLEALAVGGLGLWTLLSLLIAAMAPSASFLAAVPLIVALPAAAAWLAAPPDEPPSALALTLMALATAVTAALWVPCLNLGVVALGRDALVIVATLTVLVLTCLLVPIARHGRGRRPWPMPVALAIAAVLLVVAVHLEIAPGTDNPDSDSIAYLVDTAGQEGRWLSLDSAVDPWTARLLGPTPTSAPVSPLILRSGTTLTAPAPPLAESLGVSISKQPESPDTSVAEAEAPVPTRLILSWPRAMHRALIAVRCPAGITRLEVADADPLIPAEPLPELELRISAPPANGLLLRITTAAPAPIELEIIGQRFELPAIDGLEILPRPAHTIPRRGWFTDSTYVRDVVTVPPVRPPDEG